MGMSNRQTRMLAGMFPTGENADFQEEELLERAIENLEKLAFVGVTERYTDSMMLLKYTFPNQLSTLRQ